MPLQFRRITLLAGLLLAAWQANAQTTVVTFDNPAPPGSSDSFLNGTFQGIAFGTSQWRWSGPYASNPTNNIYFGSGTGTSRTFTFSPAPRILDSIRVYTVVNGTLTISDGVNATVTRSVTTGSLQTVPTAWTQGSTTVTINFTAGQDLGVDDITYRVPGGSSDTTPPTVSITSPAPAATVSGVQAVAITAADNVAVAGVQLLLDGTPLGGEDTTSPYAFNWDTATAVDGPHSLAAIARDTSGNQATSAAVSVTVSNGGPPNTGTGFALRFLGNGNNDIDRVKIRIDDPATTTPGPPVDVGDTDFTIEFWMNGLAADNPRPAVSCNNNAWIFGNIILDRDRFSQDRSFGLSLGAGRLAFGVTGPGGAAMTICGTSNVLDGQWHHIAIQRRRSDGWLWIYVDGAVQAQADGPDGDVSYPDAGVPMNFCGPGGNQPCVNSDPFIVVGAEKHDAGTSQTGPYRGLFDELHISRVLRYSANFTRPSQPFTPDVNTAGLYHLDEGQGDQITDSSGAPGGPSNGERRFGGSPAGPQWVDTTPFAAPGAATIGQWAGPFTWPLVAIHSSLMRTGEVLVWDGETYADLAGPSVRLWNPSTGTFTAVPNTRTNIFCSAHSFLPDGRLLVAGGNESLYVGINDTEIFNPVTRTWTQGPAMAFDRWYPTTVTLSDGRIMVASGSITCASCVAETPEIYDPRTNQWTQLAGAPLEMPLYPFLHLLPDGRVLNAGSYEDPMQTWVLDIPSQTWSLVDGAVTDGGSSAMYSPGRVMKSGTASDLDRGVTPTEATTFVIDMNVANPSWRETAPMAFPRGHHTLTILADGSVLVNGGERTTSGVNLGQAVLEAELWSPVTETWTTMARQQVGRLYHSTALLLPDGRVLSAGGGRVSGLPIDQFNAEIYSPPYLFKGARPVIDIAPPDADYGETTFIGTSNAATITRVTLLAPGTVTHLTNMQQRFLELQFNQTAGGLNVQFPANANLAPPGDYMLFIINGSGVPSVARFVSLGAQAEPLPVPVTSGISPSVVTAGGAAFTLTVDGSNFAPNSTIRWNGADRPTTFISASRLTSAIPASSITAGATVQITVFTPSPGGGTSNAQQLTINNPLPAITGLSPANSNVGVSNFTLTVNGSGFVPASVVRWNGSDRATTFVSGAQIRATITAADVANVGTAQVTVFSPAPQGGTSNAQTFPIQYAVPTTTSVTPNNAVAGTNGLTLTVNGTGFVSASIVRWNGSDRPTGLVSATQLTATVTPADLASQGTATVTVFNPTPGGGTSNAQTFTITPSGGGGSPLPVIGTLAPTSAAAGGAAFVLTVGGSSFVSGSVVRWNGANRTTTFVSATQLTAQIAAADIATAGTAQVTVFTPAPGGGTSAVLTFTVTGAPPAGGLVAAYNFDQGSGTVLTDVSGRGNNGTITGATWNTGRTGGALSFNGTSNLVTVADNATLDLTTGLTIEAWVNAAVAPTGWRTIVAKETTGNVVYYLHACTSSSNRPATGGRFGSADQVLYGGTRLTANTWVHLAATYDGTTQRLFVNGAQVASRAQTGSLTVSTGAVRIGGNQVFGEYFQGRIDDLRIYNRALTAAEITTDMNVPVAP
jgi:hypothetical protein